MDSLDKKKCIFAIFVSEMSCCSRAAGTCRNVCSKIPLVTLGADAEAREKTAPQLLEFCSPELGDFWNCVNSTLKNLHCCEKAANVSCQNTCRKTLQTKTTDQEFLDALSEKCGPVLPHIPLWSCLLQSAPAKPVRLPLEIGKLACCSKATQASCRNLCWRAFQADWEVASAQLESQCLSVAAEGELRRCLEDADDACEMGCAGLSYCARFNDRPTTLFRTCSAKADEAAKWEADHWARGGIIRGLGVQVRAAPSCPAKTLRAAACLLQLRPCESRVHETRLCREDCLELMTSCVDWSAVTGPYSATTLCSKLSPPKPDMPCVSLRPFLEDPREEDSVLLPDEDITTPCKDNPCPQGQTCVLHPASSKSFSCVPACALGEMSKQLVPLGSWIQVPRYDQQKCLKICQCTPRGLEKCRPLNCFAFGYCWVQQLLVTDRANFYLECNPCQCNEGEVTCSRKSCGEIKIPSLPCDCPSHYVPVCGRLGATFASACLAKCYGLSAADVDFGSCSSRDPCAGDPCSASEKCVRRPRVCLSPIYKPCRQFECVPLDCDPRDYSAGPVCDRDNQEHPSLCSLIKAGASLAYRGPCLRGCSLRGPVCGINGEVYPSECAAWAERTIVDYLGPCVAVGLIGDRPRERCGAAVQCPSPIEPYCVGVTPPGACCPVCGGAARLFYSRKQLDRIYYVMEEDRDKDTVTLEAMLIALGRQLQVAQCALRGSVTPEGDVFVVIQPVSKKPSSIQLAACVAEAEKLVARILERSPRIVAEVPLGSLTRAEIAHDRVSGASTNSFWFALAPLGWILAWRFHP
ncbi:reversion-inducing cysteine-rich protein with Kazal motifs isoform X2 [Orussus abietinus]|uniref:reversion-inducing cysteine-rich protein with Kazal motifs isoform X2 n=1 Tax=Orussus abietinus TaxID=222816 RepID=UPI000C71635B|nr:reversion-inducing cysteine-rich protein with Kazal motifs isoform X2 [Orussus abietinus]